MLSNTSSSPPRSAWRSRDWLIVAALTVLAFVIRLYGLEARSLWTDEFHTVLALEKPLPELIRDRLAAGHLPTYFILMKLWSGVAGMSDWALRFPSALAGAFLVPAAAFFARPFLPRLPVLALAAVACINSAAVWAGQEARMYALLGVTATLCHGFYLRTMLRPRRTGVWAAYYLTLLASVSLQPVMLLWYVAHLVFSASLWRRRREHARVALGVAAALLAALVPAALAFGGAQQKFTGIRPEFASPWMIWTRLTTVAFGPDNDLPGLGYAARAALLILLVAGVMAWRRTGKQGEAQESDSAPERDFLRFCTISVLVPAFLLWAGECFLPNVLGPWRYQTPSAVPLWALMLWSLSRLAGPRRTVAGGATALLLAAGLVAHWRDEGSGIREAVRHVTGRLQPSDAVIFPESNTLSFALRRYGVPPEVKLVPLKDELKDTELASRLQELRPRERVWLILYRLRRQERKELLEQMSRMQSHGVLAPAGEAPWQFQKAEVIGYELRP